MPGVMDDPELVGGTPPRDEYRARRGDVLVNDVTRERASILLGPGDGQGDRMCTHLTVSTVGAVAAEHKHPTVHKRFRVLSGRLAMRIDGRESELGPGDEAEVPAGVWHHWRNVGDTAAQVIVDTTPGHRFFVLAATGFGLANAGQTDDRGTPSLLQVALMAQEFSDVLVYRRPPALLQKALFAMLRPVARARGLRGRYPERFEAAHGHEEPDPALLDYVECLPART
jgi:mannose-6-phosphate isomerase-like protein (cupin superfamily)